uniref:Uncharacterized protein n=1 Tax=Podarcis muralis TaxID=64176 RepID=A0A670J654_PODMU
MDGDVTSRCWATLEHNTCLRTSLSAPVAPAGRDGRHDQAPPSPSGDGRLRRETQHLPAHAEPDGGPPGVSAREPHRLHDLLLLGPPGCGKSLQAALLAQKYGLVNIFFGDLLREKVAAKTAVGELIKPFFESGYPVRDSIALSVLKDRLSERDCLTNGWVLHGFPRDVDQADLFKHTGFEPNRVFFLNLPTEVALQRICQRATDPVSGERYHTIFKPPADEDVHQRLRRNPRDAPSLVEKKADIYNRQVTELEDYYEEAIFLNADQDPYTIFEHIETRFSLAS